MNRKYKKREKQPLFKCCICMQEITGLDAALDHKRGTADKNYVNHPVVPISNCLQCNGCGTPAAAPQAERVYTLLEAPK